MRYSLSVVYRAAALDEIYRCLSDEFDLTKEDLYSLREVVSETGTLDLDDIPKQRDNLNLTPVQSNVSERLAVLREKLCILHYLKRHIENTYFTCFDRSQVENLLNEDNPF